MSVTDDDQLVVINRAKLKTEPLPDEPLDRLLLLIAAHVDGPITWGNLSEISDQLVAYYGSLEGAAHAVERGDLNRGRLKIESAPQ
jgi:hypothetical protein